MILYPHGDPSAVVRDVLRAPVYRDATATTARPPDPSLWSTLWTSFAERVLARVFDPLAKAFAHASALGAGRLLVALVIGVACALIVIAIVRLVVRFERASRDGGRAQNDATPLTTARDAAGWRRSAAAAAARGDYARAIAALFNAALAVLDECALVALDPARTPGEYRRAVRRAHADADAANAFDDLARRFVIAAYASERSDATAYAEAERAFERFVPAARA